MSDMGHWIEPEVLADAQRTGYNSPLLPGMAPAGVQHYVNRPGQLGNIMATVKSSLPTLLVGAVVGAVAWPWLKKKLKIVGI